MAFYLSPGVYVREVDLTTTVPAVATSIGAIALRNTYKGPEYETTLITQSQQLTDTYGYPTNNSYQDMLASLGYLTYGRTLYCTRVMPEDATFAGTKLTNKYGDGSSETLEGYTFDKTGSNDTYSYTSLGTTDLTQFPDQVGSSMDSNEVLRIIARSRGNWGNNIRVLAVDKDVYYSVKYMEDGELNLPSGYTVTASASAMAVDMYNAWDVATTDVSSYAYPTLKEVNITFDDAKQFLVVVQAKDQGETNWETKEEFIVSADENAVDDQNQSMFVESVINEQSNYIYVSLNDTMETNYDQDGGDIVLGQESFVQLSNGYNGVFGRHDSIDAQAAENSLVIEAYELYDNPDGVDVNIFIDSNKGTEVKRKLITICDTSRKDAFAILDTPKAYNLNNKNSETTDLVKWRKGQDSSDPFNPNTSYSAIYGNWIEVFDKWNKKYRWIAPSGHMAGIYANTDFQRDAWWAPAGLNRAVIQGVRRLAWNPTSGERDILYKNSINPIVSFAGQGKVVWGQKTLLDKSSAFNRINVRRLFLVLEKSISKAAKYFLFEQNDEQTWILMTDMIEPFLAEVKGRRGIYDYYVQIDETTNTEERMDRNELWGNIWIKPTRAAEFIVLNFIATKTGAEFSELIESGIV